MDKLSGPHQDLLEAEALIKSSREAGQTLDCLQTIPKKIERLIKKVKLLKAQEKLREEDVGDFLERYEEATEDMDTGNFSAEIKTRLQNAATAREIPPPYSTVMNQPSTNPAQCVNTQGPVNVGNGYAANIGAPAIANGMHPNHPEIHTDSSSQRPEGVFVNWTFQEDTDLQKLIDENNNNYRDIVTALKKTAKKIDNYDVKKFDQKLKRLKSKYDRESVKWLNGNMGYKENLLLLKEAYEEALEDFDLDSFDQGAIKRVIASVQHLIDETRDKFDDLEEAKKLIKQWTDEGKNVPKNILKQVDRLVPKFEKDRVHWQGQKIPDEKILEELVEGYNIIIDMFDSDTFVEELKIKMQPKETENVQPTATQLQYADLQQAVTMTKIMNTNESVNFKLLEIIQMYENSESDWKNNTNSKICGMLDMFYQQGLKSLGEYADYSSAVENSNHHPMDDDTSSLMSSDTTDSDDACSVDEVVEKLFITKKRKNRKTRDMITQVEAHYNDMSKSLYFIDQHLQHVDSTKRYVRKINKAKTKFSKEAKKEPTQEILTDLINEYEDLLEDLNVMTTLQQGVKNIKKEQLKPLLDQINAIFTDLSEASAEIDSIEASANEDAIKCLKKLPNTIRKLLKQFNEEQNSWMDDEPPDETKLQALIHQYENATQLLDDGTFMPEIQQRVQSVARPCTPPGKPTVTRTTATTVKVSWQHSKPLKPDERVINYIVQHKMDNKWSEQKRTENSSTSEMTFDVLAEKSYIFRVIADCGMSGLSYSSPESDLINIPADCTAAIKLKLRNSAKVEKKGTPNILKLQIIDDVAIGTDRIKKCSLGKPLAGKRDMVIMVVGATGSGKTTWINGIINYIFGVNWKDEYRLKLITEDVSGKATNQAESQTSWITSYTLHHVEGMNIPYTLTIIDTPGFGDTRGIMRDKEITAQISKFFSTKGKAGIDHIDAIGFVAQAGLPRLTPTQKYVFDSILGLFGKDIKENIFLLLTFADGQKPPALSGIQEARMPYQEFFKFNSSALFATNTDEISQRGPKNFDRLFWIMGMENYRYFFEALNKAKPKTLTLSQDVLRERDQLQALIQGIQSEIQTGLNKMEQLQTEAQVLKNHQSDLDKNKDFKYTVEEEIQELAPIAPGSYTTNCLICKRTCHYPCAIKDDSGKASCAAMNGNGNCKICPKECRWNEHKNLPHKYEIKRQKVTKTASDLKKRYEDAQGKKLSAEQIVKAIVEEIEAVKLKTAALVTEVRKCITRLNEIALKPNVISTVEYIDLMIQSEESETKPGWKERVKQLNEVKKQAEYIKQLSDGGFDPFAEYRKKYEEEKKQKKPGVWATVGQYLKPSFWKP